MITELDLPLSTEAVDARFAVDQNLTVPVDEIAAQITAYRVSINGKSGTVSAD